jgi:hypothetical protein
MPVTEFLTTLAQLGVAVAGYSGVVLALGRPATGELIDRALLGAILLASAGIVLWSLIPLLLITAEVASRTVWVISSAGWTIQQVGTLSFRVYEFRRYPAGMRAANSAFTISMFVGGFGALALQIANVVWLATAWPHLAALVWWLVFTFMTFLGLMSARVQ